MSRKPSGSRGHPTSEPIDVEEYLKSTKTSSYGNFWNLEDDGIEAISARTYRRDMSAKATTRQVSKGAGPPPPPPSAVASGSRSTQPLMQASTSSHPSSSNTHPHLKSAFSKHPPQASGNTGMVGNMSRHSAMASHSQTTHRVPNGVNHPSQIGHAVQQMRQQQQQIPRHQQKRPSPPSQISGAQKRRKVDRDPLPSFASTSASASTPITVTIPVGPPGKRSMLSTQMPASDFHDQHGDRLNSGKCSASRSNASAPAGVKRPNDVIELFSDEEVEKILTPPRKKQKQKETSPQPYIIVSSDSEGEGGDVDMKPIPQFDGIHKWKVEDLTPESAGQHLPEPESTSALGLVPALAPGPEPILPLYEEEEEDHIGDINDSERWHSSTYHLEDEEDEADIPDLAQLQIDNTIKHARGPPRRIHPDTSRYGARPQKSMIPGPVEFIWDILRIATNVRHGESITSRRAWQKPTYVRPWKLDFDLHKVEMQHSFKKAPGTINKIEQRGGWTAIASASVGGLPDDSVHGDDERSMVYNRPGSLLTWGPKGLDMPSGHTKVDQSTQNPIKYYAVHDIKFDPLSTTIVSSGADKMVRVWNLREAEDNEEAPEADLTTSGPENRSRWRNDNFVELNCVPHDLVFKPNSSILAVAEKSCNIYDLTSDDSGVKKLVPEFSPFRQIRLHPKNKPHTIGSMAWGFKDTEDRIFLSSEPDPSANVDVPLFDGVHKAYNTKKQAFEYQFDATEAGDVMAVNCTGDRLALSTRAAENTHILRLYDISRQRSQATATIHLDTFEQRYPGFEGEVNCAAFSPDGLYLALGRNDNRVHVYDVRMLYRGPLLDYGHWGESRVSAEGDGLYGIVKVQWLYSEGTRRNALVTGGEDGCVRLWDPSLSGKDKYNGTTVARMNSDIAHFSIGDRFKGEHQLVAGDSSGEVMIFNNIII